MILPTWLYPCLLVGVLALAGLMAPWAFLHRPHTDAEAGTRAYRYHWGMLFLALPGPLLAAFFCVMGCIEPPDEKDLPIFVGLFCGSAIVGFPVCWEIIRCGFATTPGGLDVVSPWRGRWFIPWAEVDALSFYWGWFVVESRSRGSFCIPLMTAGLNEFLEECERNLKVEQLGRAIRGYTAVGRKFPYVASPPRVLGRGL
jgi:hypothetical protein